MIYVAEPRNISLYGFNFIPGLQQLVMLWKFDPEFTGFWLTFRVSALLAGRGEEGRGPTAVRVSERGWFVFWMSGLGCQTRYEACCKKDVGFGVVGRQNESNNGKKGWCYVMVSHNDDM